MFFLARATILLGAVFLCACSYVGLKNPFTTDPFTGGRNSGQSALLNIALPPGFQVYPSHGFSNVLPGGQKEGLETYRGYLNENSAALALFNTLKNDGWQLRLSQKKDDRAVYLYQKHDQYALITFHKQGVLTIMEIWTGTSLPDNSILSIASSPPLPLDDSIQPEEFGPVEEHSVAPGASEQWGGTVEERPL